MSRIAVVLKNKEGHFLAQVTEFEDKILVGSGDRCHLCIPDPQVESIEIEISFIEGSYWLHVSKESDPVFVEGTQIRDVKIEKDTQIHFKDYLLEVLFKEEVNQPERTRIVDPVSEDKTLEIENAKALTQEITFSRLKNEMYDQTRIVDQNTRIIDQNTRIVNPEDKRSAFSSFAQDLNKPEDLLLGEHRASSYDLFSKDSSVMTEAVDTLHSLGNSFRQRPLFLIFFAFAIILAILTLRPPQNKSLTSQVERPPLEKPQAFQKNNVAESIDAPQTGTAPAPSPISTKVSIQTVSKEAYLNAMDSLFENTP